MKQEIERKFLIIDESWRGAVTSVRHLRDGLIAVFGGGKVRVRVEGARAWIALKGPRAGCARLEFEYDVPLPDAERMLKDICGDNVIEKTRYIVVHDGRAWEIDVHHGELAGLTYAEVELEAETAILTKPDWVGAEITGDPAYSKRNLLARHRKQG